MSRNQKRTVLKGGRLHAANQTWHHPALQEMKAQTRGPLYVGVTVELLDSRYGNLDWNIQSLLVWELATGKEICTIQLSS